MSRERREKPCQIGVEEDCNLGAGGNGMLYRSPREELFSREISDVAGVSMRGSFKAKAGQFSACSITSWARERRWDVIARAPCRLIDTPLQRSAAVALPEDWFCARPSRWSVTAADF
jgi:hypothetical protein